MYPYLFTVGGQAIPSYPLLYGSGLAVGGIVVLLLGSRMKLDVRKLAHLVFLCSLAIVIGARLCYFMQHNEEFTHQSEAVFDLSRAGLVMYGGLFLAIPTLLIATRALGLPLGMATDLVAVSAPLGLAVGRWACFCRGCCFGKPSSVFCAIRYPKHIDLEGTIVGPPAFLHQMKQGLIDATAENTLAVHPAPIYASIVSLIVFFVMLWLWRGSQLHGKLIIVYPVIYAVTRFGLSFTREYKMAFWSLTISQVVSLIVFLVGVTTLWMTRRVDLAPKAVVVEGQMSKSGLKRRQRLRKGR